MTTNKAPKQQQNTTQHNTTQTLETLGTQDKERRQTKQQNNNKAQHNTTQTLETLSTQDTERRQTKQYIYMYKSLS